MNYLLACHTDIGIRKKTNQDSLLAEQALVDGKQIVLAVVCDGMGGLEKGELASAEVVRAFSKWFKEEFPILLKENGLELQIHKSWKRLLQDVHQKIYNYGRRNGLQLGTTVTAMLLMREDYYIVHVGDSRAYEITNQVMQLTKDQTLVAQEVERGNLTLEQAKVDRRRSVLLQCIGASDIVEPVYYKGKVQPDAVYLLCSDGFRHELSDFEIMQAFSPEVLIDEAVMEKNEILITETVKSRGERDNISVILVGCRKNG